MYIHSAYHLESESITLRLDLLKTMDYLVSGSDIHISIVKYCDQSTMAKTMLSVIELFNEIVEVISTVTNHSKKDVSRRPTAC